MPLRSMGPGRIDYANRTVTFNPATIKVTGNRTIAKVEAAVNAYLAANAENGEIWRVHIYTLSPLYYAIRRCVNGEVPTGTWWDPA